jgi:hypothetical protein
MFDSRHSITKWRAVSSTLSLSLSIFLFRFPEFIVLAWLAFCDDYPWQSKIKLALEYSDYKEWEKSEKSNLQKAACGGCGCWRSSAAWLGSAAYGDGGRRDARSGIPEMVVVPLRRERGMCVWERTKAIHLRCVAGSEWLLTVENGG